MQQRRFTAAEGRIRHPPADWAKEAQDTRSAARTGRRRSPRGSALDHFGRPLTASFASFSMKPGLGNHPDMIGMFRKIGAAGEDGTFARGDGQVGRSHGKRSFIPTT
jgi:hypothetical protein